MSPERWERVKALFHSALERPAGERDAVLAGECGGDAAVREEVELLLRSYDNAGSFIEEPFVRLVAGVVAAEMPTGSPIKKGVVHVGSTSEPAWQTDAAGVFSPGD